MRGDGAPEARRAISPLAAAGWTLAVAFGVDLLVTLTNEWRPGASGDLVNVTVCHLAAYLLVLFAMARVYEPETSLRAVLGLRAATPWAYLLAAAIGAGAYPLVSFLDDLVARRFPLPQEDGDLVAQLTDTHTIPHRIAVFVAFVVVIPVTEEVFFRGVLFGALKVGRTLGRTVLVTTLLALLAHEDLRTAGSTLALAAVYGWLRGRSGSAWVACIAHASFFAVPVVRLVLHPDAEDVYPVWMRVGGAVLAVLAAAILHLTLSEERRAVAGRLADG